MDTLDFEREVLGEPIIDFINKSEEYQESKFKEIAKTKLSSIPILLHIMESPLCELVDYYNLYLNRKIDNKKKIAYYNSSFNIKEKNSPFLRFYYIPTWGDIEMWVLERKFLRTRLKVYKRPKKKSENEVMEVEHLLTEYLPRTRKLKKKMNYEILQNLSSQDEFFGFRPFTVDGYGVIVETIEGSKRNAVVFSNPETEDTHYENNRQFKEIWLILLKELDWSKHRANFAD